MGGEMRAEVPHDGFLDRAVLRACHDVGRRRAQRILATLWMAIFGSFALLWLIGIAAWPVASWPGAAVLFLFIGWCQFAISNALHEATHHNLGESQTDRMASLLAAWPIGFTMGYRDVHLDHHRHFGDAERDPDYPTYAPFPRSRRDFEIWIAFNLSGLAALRQFLYQGGSRRDHRGTVGLVLSQVGLLAATWLIFGTPMVYVVFWGLPLATVAKTFAALRTLCEHGSKTGAPMLRTIRGTAFQRAVMGLFGFDYHAEHHLYPTLPYPALAQVHERHRAAIVEGGGRPVKGLSYECVERGHLALLAQWLRELPARRS